MFQKIQTQRLTEEEVKNAQNDTIDKLFLSYGNSTGEEVYLRNMISNLVKELGARQE